MAKDNKARREHDQKVPKNGCQSKKKQRHYQSLDRKQFEDLTCSVCMEHPHNAVLLLCSSYDKGCRPYMCATSYRHSNCLHHYKKSSELLLSEDEKRNIEMLCPLCRGQVKGWAVVEAARKYLNSKKRICMEEGCSFLGSYRALRKHVKEEHRCSRPRDVDPTVVEKWRKLENEREVEDVFATIRSTMPGAIVMGDYVIDGGGFFDDYLGGGGGGGGYGSWDEEDLGMDRGDSMVGFGRSVYSRHHHRLLFGGGLRRRRRHRMAA